MIYFYNIRLRFWKNNKYFFKDYLLSFADISDFLYYKKLKNSSMEIFWIKPYYSIDKRFNFWYNKITKGECNKCLTRKNLKQH